MLPLYSSIGTSSKHGHHSATQVFPSLYGLKDAMYSRGISIIIQKIRNCKRNHVNTGPDDACKVLNLPNKISIKYLNEYSING